jgi:hypothetical protein
MQIVKVVGVFENFQGYNELAPMTAPVGHSIHWMGWMICLFFIHLFTLR